jgi:hypothetical protein
MKVSKSLFLKVVFAAFVLFPASYYFSYVYGALYTGGDQLAYNDLYDALKLADLTSIPFLQYAYTNSSEPLYGLLAWVGSRLMPKNEWFSIFNALLILLLFAFLERRRVSRILYPLIATNFYLYVVMFSAERLKLAILMILFFSLVSRPRWKIVAGVFSVVFHFQSVLFAAGFFGPRVAAILRGAAVGKLRRGQLLVLIVGVFGLFAILMIFGGAIAGKMTNYIGSGLSELTKFAALFAVALLLVRDKFATFMTFLPLALASFILGDERVNIVTFAFVINSAFSWNRGLNPIALALLVYFSFGGLNFLTTVEKYGTSYLPDIQ